MVGSIFYNLFIMPLELLFEIIFSISYRIFSNPGISILFLSLTMNFLVLPLYRRADAIQEEEKNKVNSMSGWTDHIKRTFKGDERYMMINEYYRQQGYNPLYSLRSSLSLVLQVPFFIAAYHYLSNLSLLKGMEFLIFKDLGMPDGLLVIGSLHINIMPIIMTLFNVFSAYVYLRGFPLKNKIQTYLIAAVFLVLLYNSPSGLVFYWTLNQIFSLCKNLIMKAASKRKDAAKQQQNEAAGAADAAGLSKAPGSAETSRKSSRVKHAGRGKRSVFTARMFIPGAVFMTLFLGCVIPLSVISSSPVEFVTNLNTPARIVINNLCTAAGVFIIWMGIFYYLAGRKGKKVMSYLIWTMSIGAVINFLFFGHRLGTISTYLIFDEDPHFEAGEIVLNSIIVVLAAFALCVFMRYLGRIVPVVYLILIIAAAALCIINTVSITPEIREAMAQIEDFSEEQNEVEDTEKILPLSRTGQNVVILMMDRAMSGYIPYMFEEKPELAEEFDGFTYYPNTLAFGGHTNLGIPPIFGGYEYTPAAMNARTDMTLSDKHGESQKVMPVLFTENGFHVTLCDTAYANYKWTADMSFYDGMDNVDAYTTIGRYSSRYNNIFGKEAVRVQTRNFFMYSVMKAMPVASQVLIYDEGDYFTTGEKVSFSETFINSYSVLCELPDMTRITDDSEGNYIFLDNESTHEITLLKTPEYEPGVTNAVSNYKPGSYVVNGREMKMETERQISHYHVNMASFLKLGQWFEFLKKEGVYDNTRIIIVSDHGYGLGQFDYMVMPGMLDVQWYNSMLMVKDFGADGQLVTDRSFMTSADTPYLAMEGLIEDMTNPFTGNPINMDPKKDKQLMTTSHNYSLTKNDGYSFDTSDGEWFSVHDDIFNIADWNREEAH